MNQLIIIGARGFGRIVYNIALDCIHNGADFQIKGFLDDNFSALDGFDGYPKILSSVEQYEIQKNDVFICALGEAVPKKKYTEIILNKGGRFISLVSPKACIQTNVKIGVGCIIGSMATVACDSSIGDYVTILGYADIGHDVTVGTWSHIGAYVFLGGFVNVGECVMLQTAAKIIPNKKVEDNAYVGVGSVVLKNVRQGTKVIGYPAKVLNL